MEIKEITKVFIIESPSRDDIAEGREEGKALSQILNLTNISNRYFFVEDLKSFTETMKEISTEVESQKDKYGAISLHFSMHGNEEAIGFTSDESLSWKEFYLIIKEFNDSLGYIELENTRKFAPISLNFSVCKGFFAATIKNMGEETPYHMLVAPIQSINWADSIIAFAVFYHTTLHKELGVKIAVERMNFINEFKDIFRLDFADGIESVD